MCYNISQINHRDAKYKSLISRDLLTASPTDPSKYLTNESSSLGFSKKTLEGVVSRNRKKSRAQKRGSTYLLSSPLVKK